MMQTIPARMAVIAFRRGSTLGDTAQPARETGR
ncbi:hypothetical protein FB599_4018 [Herbaspirillum sp. SJZ130]|nr:hypothetical protein [Herbaspirillum sp. SJZ102]TQK00055.1 hypothetical protein FB599_4018 [Herbaspirillum sp. SJZ130]TQK04620.1 hypothetical protein FB598_3942 [Herbaspirillum sp. SJZ106]TWC65079.1 hypothetical protein FB597_10722 [Herbaspirillum sp. SJZ099]